MANDEFKPDDADNDLFRRLMQDTRPLEPDIRAPEGRPKPAPQARFRRQDEGSVLQESLGAGIDEVEIGAGETLSFNRPTVGRRTMRKLARGNYSVQAEIDLHGMTAAEADDALQDFIDESLFRGHTCVRIIHGKGRGSGHRGPVLKTRVNSRLRRRREVLAFASARQAHGGTGAVNVLLQKR